jgi:hypothetical protein
MPLTTTTTEETGMFERMIVLASRGFVTTNSYADGVIRMARPFAGSDGETFVFISAERQSPLLTRSTVARYLAARDLRRAGVR